MDKELCEHVTGKNESELEGIIDLSFHPAVLLVGDFEYKIFARKRITI
jgi:hypothetical protein